MTSSDESITFTMLKNCFLSNSDKYNVYHVFTFCIDLIFYLIHFLNAKFYLNTYNLSLIVEYFIPGGSIY